MPRKIDVDSSSNASSRLVPLRDLTYDASVMFEHCLDHGCRELGSMSIPIHVSPLRKAAAIAPGEAVWHRQLCIQMIAFLIRVVIRCAPRLLTPLFATTSPMSRLSSLLALTMTSEEPSPDPVDTMPPLLGSMQIIIAVSSFHSLSDGLLAAWYTYSPRPCPAL